MEISIDYKQKVRETLLARRQNFGGTDAQFAKMYGLNGAIYSRLNKGEIERIISDSQWLNIGRLLDINKKSQNWKVVKTLVYNEIDSSLKFCQQYSLSVSLADICGIGKSFCAKHIIANELKNAFYVDCSQAKTKHAFTKHLAQVLGIDSTGKFAETKANIKYYLNQLESPLVVLDEVGDLEYPAFLDIKEYWNGTEGQCAWYMMGADAFKAKILKGIQSKKVGYAEIFSRFSDEFIQISPVGGDNRKAFRHELLTQVASANHNGNIPVEKLVMQCMKKETTLRHLDTLIKISA